MTFGKAPDRQAFDRREDPGQDGLLTARGAPSPADEVTMSKVVRQSVVLRAPPRELYAQYLSPRAHAGITGSKVAIGARPGTRFSAFGGALSGRTLQTIPGKLIVQAWRSRHFHKADADSTLILRFLPAGRGRGRIELVHVNVPRQDYKGVSKGWPAYYWKPWRKYLAKR
jgi:activator of HSP90 ATPase